MAYDEKLAERIRQVLAETPYLAEKKMFGGVGFMIGSNMACGVHKDMLVVRVGAEGHQDAIAQPFTIPFDITGKPMKGWVMIQPQGIQSKSELKVWVDQGVQFALTLPKKE